MVHVFVSTGDARLFVFAGACVRLGWLDRFSAPFGASGRRIAVSKPLCDVPLEALEPVAGLAERADLVVDP